MNSWMTVKLRVKNFNLLKIACNYSNAQRNGIILNFTAVLFDCYNMEDNNYDHTKEKL